LFASSQKGDSPRRGINPVANNLILTIGSEWGVPICSQAHKKETPHDTVCSQAHKKETPHDTVYSQAHKKETPHDEKRIKRLLNFINDKTDTFLFLFPYLYLYCNILLIL